MSVTAVLLVATAIVAAIYAWILGSIVVDAYLRFRGPRVVRCPEAGEAVVIELDALRASVSSLGRASLHVGRCTRWPEREECDQACLRGIDPLSARDHGLLVRELQRKVRAPRPVSDEPS